MKLLFMLWFITLGFACGSPPASSLLQSSREARALLGSPVELPHSLVAALEPQTLARSWLAQRQGLWSIWNFLLGSATYDARFTLSRWQSWYASDDLQAIFLALYSQLDRSERQVRRAFGAEAIAAAIRWHDFDQFADPSWDQQRFQRWLDAYSAPQSQRAIPGLTKILFNRPALEFMLGAYPELINCLRLPAEREACAELEFPQGAAFLKAAWRRSDAGFQLEHFASDASDLLAQWQGKAWKAAGKLDLPATDAAAMSMLTPTGQNFQLVGLHLMLRLERDWFWGTLWLGGRAGEDLASDAPLQFPYRRYRSCSAYGFSAPLASGPVEPELNLPLQGIAAAMQSATLFDWCSNPFLEIGVHNQRTNCVGCHQHAGRGWTAAAIRSKLIDSFDELSRPFASRGPSDFVWSLFDGTEALTAGLAQTVEYFDLYDPL